MNIVTFVLKSNFANFFCFCRLRNIHAKKTDERHIGEGEENHTFSSVAVQNKGKRKSRSSEEEDEDSEDQGEDYDGQEEEMRRKMKKSETYGEEVRNCIL